MCVQVPTQVALSCGAHHHITVHVPASAHCKYSHTRTPYAMIGIAVNTYKSNQSMHSHTTLTRAQRPDDVVHFVYVLKEGQQVQQLRVAFLTEPRPDGNSVLGVE